MVGSARTRFKLPYHAQRIPCKQCMHIMHYCTFKLTEIRLRVYCSLIHSHINSVIANANRTCPTAAASH